VLVERRGTVKIRKLERWTCDRGPVSSSPCWWARAPERRAVAGRTRADRAAAPVSVARCKTIPVACLLSSWGSHAWTST